MNSNTSIYYYKNDNFIIIEFDGLDSKIQTSKNYYASDMFKENFITNTDFNFFTQDDPDRGNYGFNPVKHFGTKYGNKIIEEVVEAAKPIYDKEVKKYKGLSNTNKQNYDISEYNDKINEKILDIYHKYEKIITTESGIEQFTKDLKESMKEKLRDYLKPVGNINKDYHTIWLDLRDYGYKNKIDGDYGQYTIALIDKIRNRITPHSGGKRQIKHNRTKRRRNNKRRVSYKK